MKGNLKVIFFSNLSIKVRSYNVSSVLTLESFTPLCAPYEFSFKTRNSHFSPLFNSSHQKKIQKNIMNGLGEKLQSVDFRSKTDPLPQF